MCYIANVSIIFYAPCLFYTNYPMFYLYFGTIFMHFPELTYWQDATVSVTVFCYFWFQKSYTGNIFGIGRDKSQCFYFYRAEAGVRKRDEDEQPGGCPWPAPRAGVATLAPIFVSPSDSCFSTVKIGTSAFVSSNSENISCVTFLKPKTVENRNCHCGILSIG